MAAHNEALHKGDFRRLIPPPMKPNMVGYFEIIFKRDLRFIYLPTRKKKYFMVIPLFLVMIIHDSH